MANPVDPSGVSAGLAAVAAAAEASRHLQASRSRRNARQGQRMAARAAEKKAALLLVDDASGAPQPAPAVVIVIPYRNRKPHKAVFLHHMPHILQGLDYRILFLHQADRRAFNRGAMKNLGFLYVRRIYPQDYRNITLVFRDIDFMPYKKGQFSYETRQGVVNHFFGYKESLGGIFAIKAGDFERTGGFPNYWTWGAEDNAFFLRAQRARLAVVYPQFVHGETGVGEMISLWHGWDRLISPKTGNNFRVGTRRNGHAYICAISLETASIGDRATMVHIRHFKVAQPHRDGVAGAAIANSRYHKYALFPAARKKRQQFGMAMT